MTLAWRKPPLHRSSGGCAVPDANTGREVSSYVGLARRIHVRNQHAKPGSNHATRGRVPRSVPPCWRPEKKRCSPSPARTQSPAETSAQPKAADDHPLPADSYNCPCTCYHTHPGAGHNVYLKRTPLNITPPDEPPRLAPRGSPMRVLCCVILLPFVDRELIASRGAATSIDGLPPLLRSGRCCSCCPAALLLCCPAALLSCCSAAPAALLLCCSAALLLLLLVAASTTAALRLLLPAKVLHGLALNQHFVCWR